LNPLNKNHLQITRRNFLEFSAGVALAVPTLVGAQTFIENSPSSGQGWTPPSTFTSSVGQQTVVRPSSDNLYSSVRPQPTASPSKDWREVLLSGERTIHMRRDGETQHIRYCTKDGYIDPVGYRAACVLLRDVQAGKMFTMDPKLLDILCGIQRWMSYNGRDSIIEITSGFRTTQTNNATEGSALKSMHLYGKAADIVISGASSGLVGAMAKKFNGAGGTGIYLLRGFVHIDTGASRTWISSTPRHRR